MRYAAALTFTAIILASPLARAAEFAPLGEVMIEYDPAVWKATELSGVAAVEFTCIAADCPGEPDVYATATDATADDTGDPASLGLDTRQLDDPLATQDNGIEFVATSSWSGCRARDAATLSAVGIVGGTRYRFTTTLGIGCNHVPEMPEDRFLALLRGVQAFGPE